MRPAELREIEPEDCRVLLASVTVGRLAVIGPNGAPHVVPVNFVSDGHSIAFRAGNGVTMRMARDHLVTFQVDQIDVYRRAGWSVMVHGHVDAPAETSLAPDAWVRSTGDVLVITVLEISGRQIVLHEDPRDDRGYL